MPKKTLNPVEPGHFAVCGVNSYGIGFVPWDEHMPLLPANRAEVSSPNLKGFIEMNRDVIPVFDMTGSMALNTHSVSDAESHLMVICASINGQMMKIGIIVHHRKGIAWCHSPKLNQQMFSN